ncbi:MAG TPA: DNA internalization-related competence protein ComEC/Rec2 [Deltaproteobacteria bacterium]|nr:MAG: DNA internalization-related competence protein ComEC/Rec2 [Deltaproteobacteria bacterium GWD2_42_10]HAG50313.1 DNA internalization-related competence protein ComEC/Rec2 [Deltaproteobacteria bacterium]
MDKLSQSFSEFSHKHPLVPITTIFIVGIITTSYQWLKDEITSPLLMISMLILIAAISKRWRFNFILMYFTFFLLGAALSDTMLNPKLSHSHIKSFVEQSNLINKDDSIGMRIEGVLYRAPERFPDKVRLYLNAEMIFLNSRSSHFYKEMVIPSLIKDFGDKVTGKILLTVGSESVSQFETISSEEPEMRIQATKERENLPPSPLPSTQRVDAFSKPPFPHFNPPIPPFSKGGKEGFAQGGSGGLKVKYGDRIRFITKLRIPRNFGNPGEYDYTGNLARQGIYVTGYIENERWIAVLNDDGKTGLQAEIENIRNRLRDFIDSSGVENAPIIKALILGEQGEIPKDIREVFSATGTAHIIAISGLNIGIIAFVAYWISFQLFRQSERLMLATDIKKLAAFSSIIPVLLYGAIAGFQVSTQRAVLMVLVFIVSVIFGREKGLYNTLAAAGFAILIISPLAIYDISFQLSFVSVLGIIYLFPKFKTFWEKDGTEPDLIAGALDKKKPFVIRLRDYLFTLLAVTIAASLVSGPFIAYHFHRISIVGVITNIIAVPLMGSLAVPIGLVSVFISLLNTSVAELLLKLTDIILTISIWIVDLFARIPYSSIFTTTPTIIEAVLFYLLIICVMEFKRVRIFRYALPLVILALGGNYLLWHLRTNYNENLKVTFISIGQGDSALVELPYGKRILIDGGGFYDDDFDVGERIIAPFLWKNKIKRIDYIVLSHPQSDHLKGLNFIAERFHVKEFWWNGDYSNNSAYAELMQAIEKNNIRKLAANASTPAMHINGTKISFLHPPQGSNLAPDRNNQGLDTNNNSLVVRIEYKDVSFLFSGDIGQEGEAVLLKTGNALNSTVLKVPHHGSKTSSSAEFLNKVNPRLAVASAGYLNPFGFPHPEIVKRYEALKIPVLRTDISGAITVETDGRDIKVISMKNHRSPSPLP